MVLVDVEHTGIRLDPSLRLSSSAFIPSVISSKVVPGNGSTPK